VSARSIIVAEPAPRFLARPPLVVDASLLCAVLFDEPEREQAQHRLSGRHLFAPKLLSHEVINVALKKCHRGLSTGVVERALGDFVEQAIELLDTDVQAQFALAQRYALSAYDAAYLWLAAELKAPLATFDSKLGKAALRHLGELE
jgi:predicted nucleic acid-binding protein